MRDTARLPASVKVGPGLDMVAAKPVDRMGDPGIGLGDAGHRVLNYKQLVAAQPNPDSRQPSRSLQIHLTGNMRRYMWSFDGKKFSAVTDHPIRFALNERVRVKLVNDTMMAHPILINRPIVVSPLGVRLCRPSEAVLDILPGWDSLMALPVE